MKVSYANNTLTVTTEVTKAMMESGAPKKVSDKDGNDLFAVSVGSNASFSEFGLTGNSYDAEGHLVAVMVLPIGTSEDQVKAKYGEALVKAKEYLPKIAEQAKAYTDAIDGLFPKASK